MSGTGPADQAVARRYLLGLATEAEKDLVEVQLLGFGDGADWIDAVEDELIEDYLLDRLTPDERAAFRGQLDAGAIDPERVRFIRGLLSMGRRSRASLAGALATAAALILGIGLVLQPTHRVPGPASPPAVLDLRVPGLRSSSMSIPLVRHSLLRLRLHLSEVATLPEVLRLELVSPEGVVIASTTLSSPPAGASLDWPLEARALEPGAYVVAVRNAADGEPVVSFPFEVAGEGRRKP
jgi:hypothetical protein